jgi:hypothetical protein
VKVAKSPPWTASFVRNIEEKNWALIGLADSVGSRGPISNVEISNPRFQTTVYLPPKLRRAKANEQIAVSQTQSTSAGRAGL